MVEVTRKNFEEILPKIESCIRNSSFIAVDAEFTGLKTGTADQFSLFDSVEERYKKLKLSANNFIPCQIGLSIFTREFERNNYQVESYVFFIRPYSCGRLDKRFMFQTSCLDFLCRYNFDFNKFMKEGVPFLNDDEEKLAYVDIEEGNISYEILKREHDMLINDEFITSIDDIKLRFVDRDSPSPTAMKRVSFPKDEMHPEYLLLKVIRSKYPTLWADVENDKIVVRQVSLAEKKLLQENESKEVEKAVSFMLGFTKVFRILGEVKKPIVGHNVLMDMLLCFQNFYKPLPNNYHDFKKELHSLFPVIYDTRHIWRNIRKYSKFCILPKQCGLLELYEMFKNPPDVLVSLFFPSIEFMNGRKYEESFPHDAGFDSYATGIVFLKICHFLALKSIKSHLLIDPQSLKQHFNAVAPFKNKINLGRSKYSYINLDGVDPFPDVPEVLYICGKRNQILNHYELFETLERYGTVDIKLLNGKKDAIVSVAAFGVYKDILRSMANHEDLIVTKYNRLKHCRLLNSVAWGAAIGSACLVGVLVAILLKH